MKTAQQAAANWTGAAGRATADYQTGIQNTTKDWAALTIAAIPRMQTAFDTAVANGTVQAGITKEGTVGWKTNTVAKAARYTAGYTDGAANYAAAAAKFMPAIQNAVNALTPRGDINANIDRVRQLDLALHAQKGQLGA